jgi:hypothetical protein
MIRVHCVSAYRRVEEVGADTFLDRAVFTHSQSGAERNLAHQKGQSIV